MDMSFASAAALAIAPLSAIGSLSLTTAMDNTIDRIFFDQKYNVNTAPPLFGLGNPFNMGASGEGYLPTAVRTIRSVLGALPIDHQNFQFIDLGSGMGRTMLVAEQFGFKRCVGVECSEELNAIAVENMRIYREGKRSGPVIESLRMDAAEFEFPEDPIVLYFYNPFPNEIMQRVADKLTASYQKFPRDIYVISAHPRPGNPVTKLSFLERINPSCANTDFFEIYVSGVND